jgi:hypothetical protein
MKTLNNLRIHAIFLPSIFLPEVLGLEWSKLAINKGLARATPLRQSILKRTFEDKLLPWNSTDEPASVVLERKKRRFHDD